MVYIGVTGCWATAFVGVVMGRRNQRVPVVADDYIPPPPLNFGQPIVSTRRRWESDADRNARLEAEFKRERARTERRVDKRVFEALVDWDTCCIPGCGQKTSWTSKKRHRGSMECDPSRSIPVCGYHEAVIHLQVNTFMADADHRAMRERLARRHIEEEITFEQKLDLDYESAGAAQGQIYVVRQGGLIKVGWSRKLRSRLKGYGAGVEILAHYPATRTEETELHRSLRPFLAKGREWYQDCPLLADVVADIIKRHGPPTVFPIWTVPKPDQAARPKGFPAA